MTGLGLKIDNAVDRPIRVAPGHVKFDANPVSGALRTDPRYSRCQRHNTLRHNTLTHADAATTHPVATSKVPHGPCYVLRSEAHPGLDVDYDASEGAQDYIRSIHAGSLWIHNYAAHDCYRARRNIPPPSDARSSTAPGACRHCCTRGFTPPTMAQAFSAE